MARAAISFLFVAVIAALFALGTWQVERRAWKHALIARVEAGLRAAPVDAPAAVAPDDAYTRVTATGRFIPGKDSFVQAATIRGPGWWVLTPLVTDAGRTILVNRGYVPARHAAAPPGRATITGPIRLSEPGGGFLRSNDARADRWYSRDVAAIAARRGIATAPYFIDADAGANRPGQPIAGLTVIRFADNHLVYAITWYVLALMAVAGFIRWGRRPSP